MKILVYPVVRGGIPATLSKRLPAGIYKISPFIYCFANHSKRISFLLLFLLSIITAKAVTKTSAGTGSWNTAGTWNPSGVPANGDDVIIAAGHIITIDANTNNLASLTISGTLTIGNNNTNRTVTVAGNVTITNSGVFNTAGNGGNNVNLDGNLTNNGTFDMIIGSADADVTFGGSGNQAVSGTGATTDFNIITINNTGAANNNIVEILSSNFSAVTDFLRLTKGILKMSGSYTFTNTFFNSASPTINADEGIWLNNPNVTVTGQNGNTVLSGLLRITAGTYNIGTTANKKLSYNTGSVLTVEGGVLNIAGSFAGSSSSQTITFTQSNGVITVSSIGNSSSFSSFELEATGSVYSVSGGTIVLQNAATAHTDYVNYSTNTAVTGGTLQLGNAATPAGAVFLVESTPSIYNLLINTTNTPTCEIDANATVLNDLTIGGILDVSPNNVNLTIGHNWTNNGTFTKGTGTVTFNGNSAQQIGGSVSTTFYNLTFNKSGGSVTLGKTTSISGAGTFTAGVVTSAATNLLIFNDNATSSGANNGAVPSYVHGPVRKIGNDAFTFPVGKTGAGYHQCGISAPGNITDAFTAEYMRSSAAGLGGISASGLNHLSNCEYWQLDRTTGSSSVNVTLSWNGLSNCNAAVYVNSLASLVIAHFNGTTWNSYGVSSNTGNPSSGTITLNGVSAFSPFTIGSNVISSNPLPVKFSAVKAYPVGDNNRIEWINETEDAVLKYELEKSTDGRSFTRINTISAVNNSGTKTDYDDTDAGVNSMTAFYRVKAVETTGIITYSPVVKVSRDLLNELVVTLFPNPVAGKQLTIGLNGPGRSNYDVKIINLLGREVFNTSWQHNGGASSRVIDLPAAVIPGFYFVNISGDSKTITAKLVVQ